MDDRRLGAQRHMLAAGVDQVQILLTRRGERTITDDPVLGMEDAELDDPAILEFHRQPVAHLLAGQPFCALAHRPPPALSSAGRRGHQPAGGGGILTRRWTKTPGVCTSSGSIAPTGRISCSTSTIVTRAAIAMTGLKLRCERR